MRTAVKSSKDTDMTKGPIMKLLVLYAIPLLLGNLFQQLYNTVDSLVVGNFVGTQALAAIGSTTSICNTLVKFFNGVSIGASVIISQNYGAKDDEKLYKSVQTTMALTFVCGALFTVLGYFMTPYMLRLMATPEDVLPWSSQYLRIYFLGVSGLSSDSRDIEAAILEGDKRAYTAASTLAYQIKKYIGSYAAAMNGLDAVVFTAGMGENNTELRERVCADMEFYGIKIDNELNAKIHHQGDTVEISTADSKVKVYVLPTNEELMIASDTEEIVKAL